MSIINANEGREEIASRVKRETREEIYNPVDHLAKVPLNRLACLHDIELTEHKVLLGAPALQVPA